jgi:hypothetical protein
MNTDVIGPIVWTGDLDDDSTARWAGHPASISVKKRSPFRHTIVSELTNDSVGYEPTELGFQHEGYETLAGANFVSVEGIQKLVDTSVDLLEELWKRSGGKN